MAVLAMLLAAGSPAVRACAETLSLQGSTVVASRLIEPYRREIEARAGVRLVAIGNKSVHGLVALIEGRTDMAMISSGLAREIESLKTRPPAVAELQSFEVARTRVAFAVNPANPVARLTLAEIGRMLRGEIANWRELGGADAAILTVTVQPGGGVPTTVRHELLGGRAFTPGRLIEVEAAPLVLKIVEQEAGAFGVAQLGLVQRSRVREIETDARLEQILNLVTLGPPDRRQQAVIEAVRAVAAERLF